ncbi:MULTISPECIES: hypothetical protein [unclassified Rothia (in: high G+C Gram-positive bacteria)]|uniref:hypothetical protein n=1 Tax=unclassified Rothia (in: high G+C Gram-positive bacteria) TaxID=2689056 RepID=UPI00195D64CB|nr:MULTISPECIES: hypothetical protein [unclassified Rothia (in: high G+C Gram-positive bacteria)]MBM7051726.1 hypothetical protein [Rothia sp. ZJ1223]QRZ61653.1 hypothetical protein JR346_00425 [Rothia sp. ZJ932]
MPKILHIEDPAHSDESDHQQLLGTLYKAVCEVEGVERLYADAPLVGGALRMVSSAVLNNGNDQQPQTAHDTTTAAQMLGEAVGTAGAAISSMVEGATDVMKRASSPVGDTAAGAPSFGSEEPLRVTARLGVSRQASVPDVLRRATAAIRQHVDDDTVINLEAVNV